MTQGFVGSKRPQPLGCSAGNDHQRRSPALANKPLHRRHYGPEVVEVLVAPREASDRAVRQEAAGAVAAAGGVACPATIR